MARQRGLLVGFFLLFFFFPFLFLHGPSYTVKMNVGKILRKSFQPVKKYQNVMLSVKQKDRLRRY